MIERDPKYPRAPVAVVAPKNIFADDKQWNQQSPLALATRHTDLKLIQLHRIQQSILVNIGHFEYPSQRFGAFWLENMLSRVVERRGGMKNGFLGKVEHLGNVQRKSGGALYDRFNFLKKVPNQTCRNIGNAGED